jgi:hypothetical protein
MTHKARPFYQKEKCFQVVLFLLQIHNSRVNGHHSPIQVSNQIPRIKEHTPRNKDLTRIKDHTPRIHDQIEGSSPRQDVNEVRKKFEKKPESSSHKTPIITRQMSEQV